MRLKNYFIRMLALIFILSVHAYALEENSMVSIGQGISSPSYWGGLIDRENPAGLVLNQTMKVKIGAGGYFGNSSATNSAAVSSNYWSGAFILGNGIIGAGLEFQNYNNLFGAPGIGVIHWGVGGQIQSISTTFGLSAHTTLEGGETVFDAGVILEPFQKLRIGLMIPNITKALHVFSGGVAYLLNDSIDLDVDADCNLGFSEGTIKPGVGYRYERFHISAAYGLSYLGSVGAFIDRGFIAALGIKIIESSLFSYEYRYIVAPEHRLGLTLRFN